MIQSRQRDDGRLFYSTLLLVMLAWSGVGRAEQLIVDSTPSGTIYVGLTPVGETPARIALAPGRHELSVFRHGREAVHQSVLIDQKPVRWRAELPPTTPPSPWTGKVPFWVQKPCEPVRGCGYGESRHFSPPMAEALALADALAEAGWDEDVLIGATQRSETILRPGRVLWHRAATQIAAQVRSGPSGRATALGAADVRQPRSEHRALAQIAALTSAARWLLANRNGALVRSRHQQHTAVEGPQIEHWIHIGITGRIGQADHLQITAALDIHRVQRRRLGRALPSEEQSSDRIDLLIVRDGRAHDIHIHDGVALPRTTMPPAVVLADLESVLQSAGVQVALTAHPAFRGVVLHQATLH